jgi:2-polyprenyl-3-methyl-5-hydroxy-6-metoxy-1,4-benzoquinol methylase
MHNSRVDKAGKAYWEDNWDNETIPAAINPENQSIGNYVNRRFHAYFVEAFKDINPAGKKLLEIGCAKSVWLPYFSAQHGFEVWGLDYTESGCNYEKQVLRRAGIAGQVVCQDMFKPSPDMRGQFDVVVTFGVVEHYEDTRECIEACAKFLKPGGLLITNIPNMTGLTGFAQKVLNRPVFDIHQLIDRDMLKKAHTNTGLEVVNCDYFISTNFGVCNLNGIPVGTATWYLKKIILAIAVRMSMLIWTTESLFSRFPVTRFFSPYVNCLARKSTGSDAGAD